LRRCTVSCDCLLRSFVSPPRQPTSSPLFPYTTLFRSVHEGWEKEGGRICLKEKKHYLHERGDFWEGLGRFLSQHYELDGDTWLRSEEHTSELQSRENLVCRLLLEKKKHNEQQRDR